MNAKPIANRDRLIFAMDVASVDEAKRLAGQLGDAVTFYKLGLELVTSGDYFGLLEWLVARDKKVFVDLKFFDVPATVAAGWLATTGWPFTPTLRESAITGHT